MYCPSCGSNNQEELKFCTRCGTNLGLVSNALAGKPTTGLETSDRAVGLLKDFYRGRTMTLIGAAGSALSLFKLAGVFLLGFPEKMIPIAILALAFFLLSLYAVIWGLIRWNNSSSEIKALGSSPSKLRQSITADHQLTTTEPAISTRVYSTDPIKTPGSVTEQTTHLLEESSPNRENESPTQLR